MENKRAGTQAPPEFLLELLCALSSVAFLVLASIHRSYIDTPEVYKDRRALLLVAVAIIAILFLGFLQFILTLTHFFAKRYSRAFRGTLALFALIVIFAIACFIDSPTLIFAS